MASSLKSPVQARRLLSFARRGRPLEPDLIVARPQRTCAKASEAIPGTAAAYVWLAVDVVLAACVLGFVLWLAAGLTIGRLTSWPAWRAI